MQPQADPAAASADLHRRQRREAHVAHCGPLRADLGRDPEEILLSSHLRFEGDPAATAAAAAALAEAGAGLAIVYLRPPLTPAVLEPLAAAFSALS